IHYKTVYYNVSLLVLQNLPLDKILHDEQAGILRISFDQLDQFSFLLCGIKQIKDFPKWACIIAGFAAISLVLRAVVDEAALGVPYYTASTLKNVRLITRLTQNMRRSTIFIYNNIFSHLFIQGSLK
ncbi:hypothetical protein ACJX0J_037895, partial [Zea mays]